MIKFRLYKIESLIIKTAELLKLHLLALKHASDLHLIQNNLSTIHKNDILLFSTMKDEGFRLPYFLSYYRELGVKHFIIVDNGSKDETQDILKTSKDVTIFYTEASYKNSNFGMHWLNFLLRKYGSGHWCITCDPDEFLVYPFMDTRTLTDLTTYLDVSKESSFSCIMSDMYSKKAIDETTYIPGESPLVACPYFDKYGYVMQEDDNYGNWYIQGGIRRRVFNRTTPGDAPALNKIPLVKWEKHYAYVLSMHMLVPRFLNRSCQQKHTTGILQHFKFLAQITEKIDQEMEEKQHWNNSLEYKQYQETIQEKKYLYDPIISEKYINWKSYEKFGLLNRGSF